MDLMKWEILFINIRVLGKDVFEALIYWNFCRSRYIDRVKENKRELAVGKMEISGLLFAYDLSKPSFTFIGLQKVIKQFDKHCREWDLKHNLHKIKILVCQTGGKLKVSEDYRWMANKRNRRWNKDPDDTIQKRCSDCNIHWQELSKNSLV